MSINSFLWTLRKSVGFVALSCLSVVFLIFPFLLPSVTFASPASPADGSYIFGHSQTLDQASVSVVRVVASYAVPSSSPLAQASCVPTAIGLGVLVGSWTPLNSSELNTWVLTSGSLVNGQGQNVPASCTAPGNNAPLTGITIYSSDAYTSDSTKQQLVSLDCSAGACKNKLVCQLSPCVTGSVLIGLHTTFPQPYIDLATAQTGQNTQGVELVVPPSTPSVTPTPTTPPFAQAPQFLYPLLVSLDVGNDEDGMPLINNAGQLVSMLISQTDTPSETFVNSKVTSLQTPHPNSLHDAWNSGVSDWYANHNSKSVAKDFSSALNLNPPFTAFSAFSSNILTGTQNGTSSPTVHGTPTQTTNSNSSVFGIPLPSSTLLVLAIVALALLIILFVLISYVMMRRQMARRREAKEEYAAAARRAEQDAPRIAEQERAQSQHQQNWSPQGQPQPNNASASAAPPYPIVQASPDLRCPKCQQPVKYGDNFCPNCRTPLTSGDLGAHAPLVLPGPSDGSMPAPRISAPLPNAFPALPISEQPTQAMQPGAMRNGQAAASSQTGSEPETAPLSSPSVRHFTTPKISMSVGTRSNAGIKRKHKPNEDSLFAVQGERMHNSESQQFGLFVVADGMGGHANGQEASRLAIKTIEEYMVPKLQDNDRLDDETFVKLLTDGVQAANMAVHSRNLEHHADMGTTMTAVLIVGTTAYIANVGDSRTYLYRKPGPLRKVTHDHSVVASLVEAGIIQPDDIYTHPKRNQIYRSLGEKEVIEVDTFIERLQPDDKFLLCSDGLWDMVRDPVIEKVLSAVPDPSQTGNALIQAALDGGGEDNVSVIIVHVTEATQRTGLTGIQFLARPENPQWPPVS